MIAEGENIKNALQIEMLTKKYCDIQLQKAYPQSTSLCDPTTVSEVVGGGGTDATCCQAGTRICCARLDQACLFAKNKKKAGIFWSYHLNTNILLPIRSICQTSPE